MATIEPPDATDAPPRKVHLGQAGPYTEIDNDHSRGRYCRYEKR